MLKYLRVDECRKKAEEKTVLVIGDIILDKYINGQVSRISPEAPIPVVKITSEHFVPGGAANVACNLRGFHVGVMLCGLVGDDAEADELENLMQEYGVRFYGCRSKRRCTTLKSRIIGMNQQVVRIDREDNMYMDEAEEGKLLSYVKESLPKVDVVVLSDYNKGVCTESFCKEVISCCINDGKRIIVDPKVADWTRYKGASLITPNFKEYQEVVGRDLANTEDAITESAEVILSKYNIKHILVTRSQYGMTFVRGKGANPLTFPSVQREVYDVSGAGDTVVATLAAILAMNQPIEEAIEISNYAAGLAVSKSGTYIVSLEEVADYINRDGLWFEDKICDTQKLEELLESWRMNEDTVVFTNGCFDVLHLGHIEYLNRARNLGDRLIIGLNSDASVKRLKGENRPINNERARLLQLAALQCVDAVILFNEDTPKNLISVVKPEILVKGGDYNVEAIIGREYAGKTCTIPLTEGYSSTEMIKKLKNCEKL